MVHPFLRVVDDARAYTKRFKVSDGIGGSASPFLTQEYIIRRNIDPKSDYVFVLYRGSISIPVDGNFFLPSNEDYDRVEKSVRKRLVSRGVKKGYNFELPPVIGISIGGSRKSLADLIDEVKARCNEVPIEEKFIVK